MSVGTENVVGSPRLLGSVPIEVTTKKSNEFTHRAAKAYVVGVEKRNPAMVGTTTPEMSTAIPSDPLSSLAARGEIIEPPFDLFTLAMLGEHSSELGPCVEAMEVNIDGYGHRFIPHHACDPHNPNTSDDLKQRVLEERVRLENWFNYATLEDPFVVFRRKLRKDLELTGNAYCEVIRGTTGEIQGLQHIPSYHMRLGRTEERPVEVAMPFLELQTDRTYKVVQRKVWKRFRKYAQSRATYLRNLSALGGYKTIWFKEFQDPRVYDNKNGNRIDDPVMAAALPYDERANEMLHFRLYSSRSPYGLPRYIGNLISIFGDRASEEINYITFKNNNVPSMIVAVSNGQLTEGSIKRIEDFTESQIQGSDNWSKFLIIEAEGSAEGEDGSQMKIDVKPLVDQQHKDALFQNYSEKNHDKIRRAFRLPEALVGSSAALTRATADTSRRLADEQIFAPERDVFDALINRRLFPDMGVVHHSYKTNSPSTTDNTQLVQILGIAEKSGGITPRIARGVLEEVLNRELPPFPKDFPTDVPFSMTMAEAVKNMADPTEPGQQVTALKRMFQASALKEWAGKAFEDENAAALLRDDEGDRDAADDAERLLAARRKIDAEMRREVTRKDGAIAERPDE